MKKFVTQNVAQTKKLGELLAQEILTNQKRPSLFGPFWSREARPLIIRLEGELGSGKTTFAQGILKGLGVKGPYTSPTFVVIRHYKRKFPISNFQFPNKSKILKSKIQNIYHIDAYRVSAKDILNLGWKEIVSDKNNVVIIEWADRIKKIIPKNSLRIKFEWIDENERKITIA